jgi:hypothetical protein
MLSVSNSEIQLWKTCRRKWYITHYLQRGLERRSPVGPLVLGTRVHAALEGYYGYGRDPLTTLRDIYRLDAPDVQPEYAEELSREQDLAEAMISGYTDWLEETGADEGLTVVSAEREVSVPFPALPDISIRGKLDAVVHRLSDNSQLFIDHKTCQTFLPADYWQRDEQAKFYQMLKKLEGRDDGVWVSGGVFNMLRKVKRTANAKPPFYKREATMFNNDELNSLYLRTYAVLSEIRDARTKLDDGADPRQVVYPHPTKDCNWACPFAGNLCEAMDDGSAWQEMAEREFTHVDPYARYSEDSYLDRLGITA